MAIFNKRWVALLAGVLLASQSALVSANLITDYALEFSEVDAVHEGESFDVDVFLDIPLTSELASFGFNFVDPLTLVTLANPFTHISFDGFSVASWILEDNLNDVGGLADPFGPNGDNIQIATLHFTALSEGIENISAYGEFFQNGGGAYFYDFDNDVFYDGSFGGTLNVRILPEPSSIAVFLLGGLLLLRMRKTQLS